MKAWPTIFAWLLILILFAVAAYVDGTVIRDGMPL